jgi:hypothetical protein
MTPGTLIAEAAAGIEALGPTAVMICFETETAPSTTRPPGANTVPAIVQSSAAWAFATGETLSTASTIVRAKLPKRSFTQAP